MKDSSIIESTIKRPMAMYSIKDGDAMVAVVGDGCKLRCVVD